ncbi:MAG: hypothetical protein DMF61_07980 [Blastocatellia bacterium AA13]|nr:MAG: hypothetical protein DMF61_07980 [Blastocatellia bacterium AA13]
MNDSSDDRDPGTTSRREMLLKGSAALAVGLAELFFPLHSAASTKKRKKSAPLNKQKNVRGKTTRSKKKKEIERDPPPSGPISGAAVYSNIIAYYNLGEHRTAGEGDLSTSEWMFRQLKAAGMKTEFQPFIVRQFLTKLSSLEIERRKLRVFPLWPPLSTGPTPIRARVANFEAGRPVKGSIAIVKFPFDPRAAISPLHIEKVSSAAKAGAIAVLAVTEGSTGEIIALNTNPSVKRWPIPVGLVGPRDEAALITSASTGAQASLLIDGREESVQAKNVIGRLDRGRNLFIVSTPQSGWFRCAGERGPGIGLFVELAKWARKSASDSSFLFVSTSGHELGGIGVEKFIKQLAPRPDRVTCWIHLGAGIATYEWEDTERGPHRLHETDSRRRLMCRKELVELLREPFSGLAGLTPVVEPAVGDYQPIAAAGYRVFAIAAASKFHHTPADSPEMTGPDILEPVGTALVNSIEAIEAKFGKN